MTQEKLYIYYILYEPKITRGLVPSGIRIKKINLATRKHKVANVKYDVWGSVITLDPIEDDYDRFRYGLVQAKRKGGNNKC